MSEPQQTPTPEDTPAKSKSRPPAPQRSNSDTSQDDQGYESRSRSQSRRRRRQNQRQRQSQGKAQAGNAKADSMAKIEEQEEPQQEPDKSQWLKNPAAADVTEYQPFENIKPPSQSMDGPVTHARMMRGEIPWRGPPPSQPLDTVQSGEGKSDAPDPMDQDGLKLRIELNLDIEIELKAHIHGDITLALLLVPPYPSEVSKLMNTNIVLKSLIPIRSFREWDLRSRMSPRRPTHLRLRFTTRALRRCDIRRYVKDKQRIESVADEGKPERTEYCHFTTPRRFLDLVFRSVFTTTPNLCGPARLPSQTAFTKALISFLSSTRVTLH